MSKLIVGVNDLATVNPKLASQWDYEKNEKGPSEYTPHSNFKVNWLCNTCGMSYVASINKRSYGRGCPYCAGKLPIPGKTDLATVNPQLASQWDYEKNEKIGRPEEFTVYSHKKINWKCTDCGMIWKAKISDRSRGKGCPYCAGKLPIPGKTDLATVNPQLASQWDYEKNEKIGRPEEFTVYSHKKINWKCLDCKMTWEASISARSRGEGCPYCAGKLPIPGKTDLATVNPQLASQWDYERNKKRPEDYTANSGEKVWWKSTTGYSWKAPIYSRSNGKGDPYLSGWLPIPGKTDLATVMPQLAAQWDYERNEKGPEDYTVYSGKKVWWKSTTGYSWKAPIYSRSNGKGDPYLSGRLPIPGKTDLATVNPQLASQWDYERNKKRPEDYTAKTNKKIWWICPVCGCRWFASISGRANGARCPNYENHKDYE